MNRVLFLDDDQERHNQFRMYFSTVEEKRLQIDYVYSYADAVSLLTSNKYDVAYLDHDLSFNDRMCDPDKPTEEKTGSDLAKFIVNNLNPKHIPDLIVIHSFNPVGAKNMQAIFSSAGIRNVWRPFNFYG